VPVDPFGNQSVAAPVAIAPRVSHSARVVAVHRSTAGEAPLLASELPALDQ